MLSRIILILVVSFAVCPIIKAEKMDQAQAEQIWDEYHQKVLSKRQAEAKVIVGELKSLNIDSENAFVIDATFFSNDEAGVKGLESQLSQNYEVKTKKSDNYWFIEVTTRPYAIHLENSEIFDWVNFMHEVALSHRAIFSKWVLTEPELNKVWASEDIETGIE